MAVFRGGLRLDFNHIIRGLTSVGRAIASISRISVPAPRAMPAANLQSILRDATRITELMQRLRGVAFQRTWGRMPVMGGIAGAFGQARAGREEMRGVFGAMEAAGMPAGRMTRMVSALTLAAGPAGHLLRIVKQTVGFFVRLTMSTVRFGISLAKLPFTVLTWIHRSIQSIMFSFIMLSHLVQRFFRDAFQVMRSISVATVVASGSLDELGKSLGQAVGLGAKYAISLSKVAEGYVKVAKAGFAVSEQNEIMFAAVQAGTILQGDLIQVLDVTITSLKAWDMAATESGNVLQILTNAVTKTKATWTGMATSLGYAAAAASEANVPFQDTVAIISQFIDKGLRASRAGMAFRTMVAGLDKVIGHAAKGKMNLNKAIEVLGINWVKYADKAVLPLIDIMGELNQVMSDGLDTQERLALMQVFGRRYYSQIIRLAKEGSDVLHDFADALLATNELEQKATIISNSLIGVFVRLKNIWLGFKVTLLEQLGKPLESVSGALETLLKHAKFAGQELGRMLRVTLIEPAIGGIAGMLGVGQIGDTQMKIKSLIDQIGGWIGLVKKETVAWIETVTGKAYEGTGNIIDLFGTIFQWSMKISASVLRTFMELTRDNRLVLLIDRVAFLIERVFPPFLKLVLDVATEIVTKVGSLFGVDTENFIRRIATMRMDTEGFLDNIRATNEGSIEAVERAKELAREARIELDVTRTAAAAAEITPGRLLPYTPFGIAGYYAALFKTPEAIESRRKTDAANEAMEKAMSRLNELLESGAARELQAITTGEGRGE